MGAFNQAMFLLNLAEQASPHIVGFENVKTSVEANIELGKQVIDGKIDGLPKLLKFIEDPHMAEDFGSFYELVKGDEKASAALHIASYSCAFAARVVAEREGFKPLPDPVLEALPEVSDFFFEQAKLLKIA